MMIMQVCQSAMLKYVLLLLQDHDGIIVALL